MAYEDPCRRSDRSPGNGQGVQSGSDFVEGHLIVTRSKFEVTTETLFLGQYGHLGNMDRGVTCP